MLFSMATHTHTCYSYPRAELLDRFGWEVFVNRMSIEMIIELSAVLLEEINIVVVSLYRPSTSKNLNDIKEFFDRLNYVLEYLCKLKTKIIICGDFNIDFKETSQDNIKELKNCLTSFGLYLTNDQITRPNPHKVNEGSCIDNIVTNLDKDSVTCSIVKTWVSDHWALHFTIKAVGSLVLKKSMARQMLYRRCMKEVNISKYKKLLGEVDWHSIYFNYSVDYKIFMFLSTLDGIVKNAFPLKLKKNKSTLPKHNKVFCPELDKLKDLCDWFYDLYNSSGLDSAKALHSKCKKHFKAKLKECRRKRNDDIILRSENKSAAMWGIINKECNTKQQASTSHQFNLCSSQINIYFIDKVNEIVSMVALRNSRNKSVDYLSYHPRPSCTFDFQLVRKVDVVNVLKNMKTSKCEDIYGFNSMMLKLATDYISEPLTNIVNSCILNSVFPDSLKLVKVVPVYKKGSKSECGSYRPISLVPVISKLFEGLMNNQIINFFESNNLFSDCQYGYRLGMGTVKATLSLYCDFLESLESKNITEARFFDLSKAFDTVSHDILLSKLSYYGFKNSACQLVSSYLKKRYQKVVFNNSESQYLPVSHGVPQGSILGPVLFIIYVNDLPNVVGPSAKGYLFADDFAVCISRAVSSNPQILDDVTVVIENWCNANLLCLNLDKTQDLLVTYNYGVDCSDRELCNFLGFNLDSKLNWFSHIDKIASKLNKGIFMLRKLRTVVSLEVLKLVYFAHIHSHLAYGTLMWGSKKYSIKLFKLQKRAIRLLCGLPSRSHCRESFKQVQIMTLPALYIYHCLNFVKHNYSKFIEHNMCHNYNTRGKSNLISNFCNYTRTQQSFIHVSVKLYNALPQKARDLQPSIFKNKLKQFLKDNPIYDANEFYTLVHNSQMTII
uniref:Reverse transcriptase domain-containing protein n=1 Tax=Graphocephala atropunctata TaxID=36148 RepID=A0A1B6MJH0_9HEMI